jgi:ABC-type amino acid transport system permease subunit
MTARQRRGLAAILGGLVATVAMTLLGYIAVIAGLDVGLLASWVRLGRTPELAWAVMMAVHLVSGVLVFPLVYVFAVYPALPGPAWSRGVAWGVILWLGAQVIVLPLLGAGLFSTRLPHPWSAALWSLAAHVVYGALLGTIASPSVANRIKAETAAQGGPKAA